MTDTLIKNWNSVVGKEDLVYHLGNFAWDPKTAQDAVSQLNGIIWFIPGEHDTAIAELAAKGLLPNGSKIESAIMPLHKMQTTISYWPLADWPNKGDGYWSIIGHPSREHKSDPKGKTINVATDLWGYKPQELSKTLGIFKDL
jgi:calcineurin-like phosphoesterase family protein